MPIDKDISSKYEQLVRYWRPRDERIREWLNLEALKDDNDDDLLESALTNDPATVVGLAVHLLSYYQPLHKLIVDANASDHLLKQSGKTERAVKGWWRDVDYKRFLAGQDIWLRELAWWATTTGWITVKAAMEVGADGTPLPIADILSPLESYPEYGPDGLITFIHRYSTTLGAAAKKAESNGQFIKVTKTSALDTVILVDAYEKYGDTCRNTVFVQGTGLRPTYVRAPIEYVGDIPAICTPVNGKPDRGAMAAFDETWKATIGQSILERNRPIYKEYNRFLSLLAAVARDAAQPPWLIKGAGIVIKPEHLQSKQDARPTGQIIQTPNPQAGVERIDPGQFPVEVQTMIGILDGMVQRGGFPYLLYGGLQTQLSGFAISQLINAAFYQLGPYAKAIERAIRSIDKIWLKEFKEGEFSSSVVSGQDNNAYYLEEFTQADLPKRYDIDSTIKMAVPNDMMERIAIARQAIPNLPLMDRQTLLEDVIETEDPTLVLDRIDKDNMRVHPIIQQINLVAELRKQAESLHKDKQHETAQLVEQFADFMVYQLGATTAIPGQGAQQNSSGIAPSSLPQEAQGLSPDVMRSMMRTNPSTPNRAKEDQMRERGII